MKITPKQYALGLLEAIENKEEKESVTLINAFVGLLVKNNDTAKADKIIEALSILWNAKHAIIESEVAAAQKLDADTMDSLKLFLLNVSGASEVRISEKIDSTLLGGAIITYNDRVMDYSIKTKISDIISAIKK